MEKLKKGICSQKEYALHTHDRISFKRCRRKWQLSSPFGRHLQPRSDKMGVNQHLWFGTAIHFAMEDYHGYKRFDTPVDAFRAYVAAHVDVPSNVDDLIEMGEGMLDHYTRWEAKRATWKTVWRDGKPLVEEKFSLVLEPLCHYILDGEQYFKDEQGAWRNPNDCRPFRQYSEAELEAEGAEYIEIVYHGTMDRIVEDEDGEYWVLDYKTAAAFDTAKLPTDPQISAYCWAAEQWLDIPIAGMLYIQMHKSVPAPPTILKSGGVSTNKTQRTTHHMYRQALIEHYGEVQKAPKANIDLLNLLADAEGEYGDRFIRYDWVPRNTASKINTYNTIIMEGMDMVRKDTPIYPNPTRDCSWDCPFMAMCIAMEEGADWESYLFDFEERIETMTDDQPKWMLRLYRQNPEKYPEEFQQYCQVDSVDTLEDFLAQE